MKKIISPIVMGLIVLFTVSTSFAADATRYNAGNGSIVIDCNKTSAFNKAGKWVYTIHRYTSDNLPKNVFDIVRNTYDQFYISGMEKVDQPGASTVYLVHLEDKTSIKTVKVNVRSGETELVQDFVRG